MPSYKAEVQYLKEVIKAYQLGISFIDKETEGLVKTEEEEEKLDTALKNMRQVIFNNITSITAKHNRTRGEFETNLTIPGQWTDKQLRGSEPL